MPPVVATAAGPLSKPLAEPVALPCLSYVGFCIFEEMLSGLQPGWPTFPQALPPGALHRVPQWFLSPEAEER